MYGQADFHFLIEKINVRLCQLIGKPETFRRLLGMEVLNVLPFGLAYARDNYYLVFTEAISSQF